MRINIPEADAVIGKKFKVLDKGWVALIDYCGGDHAIEAFARNSYGKGTRTVRDTEKLIRYLVKHAHTSPLESTEVAFSLSMPIHVARQLVRHRTFSPISEYSARYSILPDIYYSEYPLNLQSAKNKQGRSEEGLSPEEQEKYRGELEACQDNAFALYNELLEKGVAREIARMHLPLNTYTYWFCKMDLNNLFRLLKLRLDEHAQWEVRQYAKVMGVLTRLVSPLAFQAWFDYHYNSVTFSRDELEKYCCAYVAITCNDDYVEGAQKELDKIGRPKCITEFEVSKLMPYEGESTNDNS